MKINVTGMLNKCFNLFKG